MLNHITTTITVAAHNAVPKSFTHSVMVDCSTGPQTFSGAIVATEDALSQFHRHYCPTDEEAIATADDAPAQEDVSNE
jgi:hypothetical protein